MKYSILGASIITNFGCMNNCWYCIWKVHKFKDVPMKTDWDKLEYFLRRKFSTGITKVSVSGGGDPLYEFYHHKDWWNYLFKIANNIGIQVDVHTRVRLNDPSFWENINRCSFSVGNLFSIDDRNFLTYLSEVTKVRLVHTVTEETTDTMVEEFIRVAKSIRAQITFRELSVYNDHNRFEQLQSKYHLSGIYFLPVGDYNHYYMPDNNLYDNFMIGGVNG